MSRVLSFGCSKPQTPTRKKKIQDSQSRTMFTNLEAPQPQRRTPLTWHSPSDPNILKHTFEIRKNIGRGGGAGFIQLNKVSGVHSVYTYTYIYINVYTHTIREYINKIYDSADPWQRVVHAKGLCLLPDLLQPALTLSYRGSWAESEGFACLQVEHQPLNPTPYTLNPTP